MKRDLDEWSPQGPVTELSDEHCWRLLNDHTFGHLGVSVDNHPEIFPVDYYADGTSIVFRTAEGTKRAGLLANSFVVFEIDDHIENGAWSVTVKGTATLVPDQDIPRTAQNALPSWIPTEVFDYVRITPVEVRGRQFEHQLRPQILAPEMHRDTRGTLDPTGAEDRNLA